MECPEDVKMKSMIARGSIKGRVQVRQTQSKVVVLKTLERMRVVQKGKGEKCG
jgi:hypothetical protein